MSASLDAHNWYTIRDRKKVGPLPWGELCRLAAAGQLKPTDMVLCEGQTRWSEAGSLPGLFPAPVAALAPEGESAPTLAPPMLPSATMLSARVDDTQKAAFVPPIQLPGYELLEELGRGGMGVVYKARQQKASRVVALKMILSGPHAGKEDLLRFQTEAEAVARLQHPHIVQVYEIGEHEGRPFFSLEFCGGGTLDRKLRDNPLVPKDAARLVEVLARAMHHAHTHHILHRDLKPANVLLTEDGVPKITDFGLAKKLDEAGQTASGAVMGTPSYMSPEQASGKARHLTPATDVYALGALLYDCLAGRPPFRAATALDTILQVITDAPVPPGHLNPKVPGDLQTICLKCLEKNPTHRYATAEELAEDLRRFNSGEPIQARPTGWLERTWKWSRRRPAAAALIGVTAVALLLILIGALSFSVRLGHERNAALAAADRAEQQQQRAEAEQDRAEQNEKEADRLRKQAEEREVRVREERDEARRSLMTAQVGRAAVLWQREPIQALQLLQNRIMCPVELRDFAWGYYHALCQSWKAVDLIANPVAGVNWVAVSPDGELAAAGLGNGTIRLFDLKTNRPGRTLTGHRGIVLSLAFNHDGTLLASGGGDKAVKLWTVAEGKEIANLTGHSGWVTGVSFSPDGQWLASTSGVDYPNWPDKNRRDRDGEARLWNVEKRKEEKVLVANREAGIRGVSFSPDSKSIAVCFTNWNLVRLIDIATAKGIKDLHGENGWVYRVFYSPDGTKVAWVNAQQVVHIANVTARQPQLTLRWHHADVYGLAWSPDGKTIASSDRNGWIKLWDATTGDERFTVRLDTTYADTLAFTPDGRNLITGHGSGRVTIWALAARPEMMMVDKPGYPAVAWATPSTDAQPVTLATVSRAQELRLWDLPATRQGGEQQPGLPGKERRLALNNGQGTSLAFSPNGKILAVGVRAEGSDKQGTEGECQLWEVGVDRRLAIVRSTTCKAATAVRFTSDGQSLIVGWIDGTLSLWSVGERKEIAPLGSHASAVSTLALSPDGKLLASAGGNTIKLWDVAERRQRGILQGHEGSVMGLAFVDEGRTLVSVGLDRTVKLWHVATENAKRSLPPQFEEVTSLAASPDGKTLALGLRDRTVRLWDLVSGQERAVLSGFTKEVAALAFSPDGRYLAAGSAATNRGNKVWLMGGELKVWKSDVSRIRDK